MKYEWGCIQLELSRLCLFKNIRENQLMVALRELVDCLEEERPLEKQIEAYNVFTYKFYTVQNYDSLKAYIANEVLYGNNLITYYFEEGQTLPEQLKAGIGMELEILEKIGELSSENFKELLLEKEGARGREEEIKALLDWGIELHTTNKVLGNNHWGEKGENLLNFYKQKGCGDFAKYYAFRWDDSKGHKEVVGISEPDDIQLDDLVGYDIQKQDILQNTRTFLRGYPANNLLLYGARGTGKSSMVKAVLNHFASSTRLRMIEIRKDQLMHLKELMNFIAKKPYYFIIFIDDLAFEDKEETYTTLKTILEGGLEVRPKHMVIYATSNRRHLIQESVNDNELHGNDAVDEKLSLSDRFGMRIGFSSPNKQEYLNIVKGIVAKRGIQINGELLEREALKWEMWNNGKSGRTAQQFANYIEGEGGATGE